LLRGAITAPAMSAYASPAANEFVWRLRAEVLLLGWLVALRHVQQKSLMTRSNEFRLRRLHRSRT
jgi:hypothetical protein